MVTMIYNCKCQYKNDQKVENKNVHIYCIIYNNLWIFLNILSTRLKSMSVEDFYSLLMECDYQQRLYAIWLRYYM